MGECEWVGVGVGECEWVGVGAYVTNSVTGNASSYQGATI